jgi:hypothetical protein
MIMPKIPSQRHSSASVITLLLFSAVLLATASSACMGDMIYNLVDYGQNGTKMEGTITTNGDYGTLTNSDITDFSITITPASGSAFTWTPSSASITSGNLKADSSSLYLTPGSGTYFRVNTPYYASYVTRIEYLDYNANPYMGGDVLYVFNSATPPTQLFYASCVSVPPQIGYNPMIIATIPEPATFTLLVWALMGLGVVYLRQRGKES